MIAKIARELNVYAEFVEFGRHTIAKIQQTHVNFQYFSKLISGCPENEKIRYKFASNLNR